MARNETGRAGKRRRLRPAAVCVLVFAGALVLYGLTQIGLYSYNIQLQQREQALSAEIREKQTAVEDLQQEVHNMQDKSRVLGMLGDTAQSNVDNVYVIDSGE